MAKIGRPKGGKNKPSVYALYKGDQFLAEGTKEEIAKAVGVSINTLNYYRTKHWIVNRRTSHGNTNRRVLIRIDKEDELLDLQ